MERKNTVLYPSIPKNEKKRIAAYCRVSSNKDEQLHSLSAQTEYYTNALSADKTCEFVGIYADEGISGTQTKNRQAFNRLMDDCRAGLIDIIMTKSVSRFGRNTVDTLRYTRELKLLGVDVYFEKENIHSANAEGELMLTIMSAMAQNESFNLSENVKWGLQRKYEEGHAESQPLGKFYGYSQYKKQISIIEEEAAVVRRVFREFLSGYGATEIAKHLTADGIPTERGNKEWCPSTVGGFLSREKYMGDAIFRKSYVADPISHKRIQNRGELEQYYAEDCFPAIVDKDTWNCVRLELERQKQYCADHSISVYSRYNEDNPFSTRIICQTCGRTYMLQMNKHVKEEEYSYWRCSSFKGKQWKEIPGMTFTPRPLQPLRLKDRNAHPWNKYYKRKLPEERTMLCTDIQILAGQPEKAFIRAWNQLCGKAIRYTASLNSKANKTDDVLLRYRCRRLAELIAERGRIDAFDYGLCIEVLDHMEVTPQGKLRVIFFAGITITV